MSTCTSIGKTGGLTFAVLLVLGVGAWAGEKGKAKGKLKTLAEHRMLANFEGAPYRLCRGLTAQCPRGCGHSGEFATFAIVDYLHYKKPGKYGDAKQKTFRFQVSDYDRKPKGDAKLLATVRTLKKGDLVLLEYHHLYGEVRPGVTSPVRPVIELRKVTEAEAKALREKTK